MSYKEADEKITSLLEEEAIDEE